jgi:hypothetical protein
MSAAMLAPQGLSAQQRVGNVVKVQGHVHELLTKQMHERRRAPKIIQTPVGSVYNINPKDIQCWVGCTELEYPADSIIAIDTAYLLVKWTDGKAAKRGDNDSILIWGYRWVSQYRHAIYGPISVTKCSIDMIRAVANFDCRFSVLLQNTGGGSFTLGGLGYNFAREARVELEFERDSAVVDTLIKYRYTGYSPNCPAPYNQFVVPEEPNDSTLIAQALNASQNTGVIKHPLDAAYSYPAYDYDYWVLTDPTNENYEWQAGWNYNYWAYYTRQGLSGSFNFGGSIATDTLSNNTTNYFIFASLSDYNVNMDGDYSALECCGIACKNCTPSNGKKKR